MKSLGKLMRLPLCDQLLLVHAALLTGLTRIGLRWLSFQTVCHLLCYQQRAPRISVSDEEKAVRLIWAVDVACRYLLDDKPCLTKALVAQRLLSRAGYRSTLQIGFRWVGDGPVTAHAWLEDRGNILIGNLHNLDEYVTVLRLSRSS